MKSTFAETLERAIQDSERSGAQSATEQVNIAIEANLSQNNGKKSARIDMLEEMKETVE